MTSQAGSIVSSNDSIRVEHGHDFENIPVSEKSCFWFVTHEKVDDAFHYEWSIRLTRMYSWTQNDCRPLSDIILRTFQIGYDEHIERISSYTSRQLRPLEPIFGGSWIANSVQMIEQIRICVWIAVGDVDGVQVVDELDLETQRVCCLFIAWYLLYLLLRHEILYIMSAPIPSIPCRLYILLRIDERFHPLAIWGIRFA